MYLHTHITDLMIMRFFKKLNQTHLVEGSVVLQNIFCTSFKVNWMGKKVNKTNFKYEAPPGEKFIPKHPFILAAHRVLLTTIIQNEALKQRF